MKMILLMVFIAACCELIQCAPSVHDASPKPCVTPKKEAGHCIDVHKCGSVMKIIQGLPKAGGAIDKVVRRCESAHEYSVCCPYENEPGCGMFHEDRIIPGPRAMIDAFPWLAIVEYKRTGNTTELACGGSLIGKKHVLTAASCLRAEKPANVRLGEYDTSTEVDCEEVDGGGMDCADPILSIPVSVVSVHPEYDVAKGSHDLAVITLEKEIKYTDFIQPVCLPLSDFVSEYNFRVAGWNLHQNTPPRTQKYMGYPVNVSLDSCRQTLGTTDLTEDHICTRSPQNFGSNTLDCGGPITDTSGPYRSHHVIGIANTLRKDLGKDGELVAYTKVYSNIDWIHNVMLE